MSCQCEVYEICPECASTPIEYGDAVKAYNDMARRIVEVERAPCQHMHAWNYDPDDAKRGFPLKALPNNQMKCMDCGEFFTLQLPKPAIPKYSLDDLEQLTRNYCDEWECETESTQTEFRLGLSLLFEYLRKREKEVGE